VVLDKIVKILEKFDNRLRKLGGAALKKALTPLPIIIAAYFAILTA